MQHFYKVQLLSSHNRLTCSWQYYVCTISTTPLELLSLLFVGLFFQFNTENVN